tara:strand:- start:175 stop:471 length:297 start_codon:yes stop_codon:yes gene_type:complete
MTTDPVLVTGLDISTMKALITGRELIIWIMCPTYRIAIAMMTETDPVLVAGLDMSTVQESNTGRKLSRIQHRSQRKKTAAITVKESNTGRNLLIARIA